MKQGQHRISQVYLKEFGYKTPSGQWKISALEKDKFDIMKSKNKFFFSQKSIKSVTVEDNIFDLYSEESAAWKLFEDLNGKFENRYTDIINDIKIQSKLSELSKDILIQFIPNLLCRAEPFRQLISSHLDSSNKMLFLKSMCNSHADKGASFINKIDKLPNEHQLNPVCFLVMEHILEKLSSFDYVILRDFENRGWATSDNPVILERNVSNNSIFSIDTEIYFPLSKDYCVFFSHSNSKNKQNKLRQLQNKSLSIASSETHEEIDKKTAINAYRLIFFPLELRI
jgi:Protein of unknown function (DUF4238)